MSNLRPENNETVWHIQMRLREAGFKIAADGDLGPPTFWDESETLKAMLEQLGGPVAVAAPLPRRNTAKGTRIYLDVGHGRKPDRFDPGAVHASSGTTEHALNTIAAEACAAVLRRAGLDVTVDDSSRHNYSAGKAAGGNDIFVSFHHNSAGGPAQGAEALYHKTKGGAEDVRLAQLIAAETSAELGIRNRGAKPMALSVVSGAEDVGVPAAVLTEVYFIQDQAPDNPPAEMMPDWSKRGGEATARGILAFLGRAA